MESVDEHDGEGVAPKLDACDADGADPAAQDCKDGQDTGVKLAVSPHQSSVVGTQSGGAKSKIHNTSANSPDTRPSFAWDITWWGTERCALPSNVPSKRGSTCSHYYTTQRGASASCHFIQSPPRNLTWNRHWEHVFTSTRDMPRLMRTCTCAHLATPSDKQYRGERLVMCTLNPSLSHGYENFELNRGGGLQYFL